MSAVDATSVSSPAVMWSTYLWHYLVARVVYDDLLGPLIHACRAGGAVGIACIAAGAFGLGHRMGKRT